MPDFLENKYTTSKMVMVIRARARVSDPLAAIILFVILEGVKTRYGVGETESLNQKSKAQITGHVYFFSARIYRHFKFSALCNIIWLCLVIYIGTSPTAIKVMFQSSLLFFFCSSSLLFLLSIGRKWSLAHQSCSSRQQLQSLFPPCQPPPLSFTVTTPP